MSKPYKALGDDLWRRSDKISGELFILTYGSIVSQLFTDYEDAEEVNIQLEQMGIHIGERLIEEFLAKTQLPSCSDFNETAQAIAHTAFKMFLNMTTTLTFVNEKEFVLTLEDNPLEEFVVLPNEYVKVLWYSNLLAGVVKGALDAVQIQSEVKFEKCKLRGDDKTEMRIKLIKYLNESVPTEE